MTYSLPATIGLPGNAYLDLKLDVDASYTYRNLWAFKEATFRVTLTNLFNREYISSIITPDNALAANTTKTSYQSGAPFGAYAGIALKF